MGLFIFTANMIGKIPGFMSPTANINVTLGCAITVWVYYHIQGVREQGIVAYVKHFAVLPGAPILIAPLVLIIETISHLSRVLSLSLRLFGNIFGEEMVVLIIASIVPFIAPLPMMVLGVVTGTLAGVHLRDADDHLSRRGRPYRARARCARARGVGARLGVREGFSRGQGSGARIRRAACRP